MDIVLLCAGTSSRMGKTNKLLLPFGNTALVSYTGMEALKFLEKQKEPGKLIAVTGYRHASTLKALKPCIDYVSSNNGKVSMIIVRNKDYAKGQFSSAKTGVKEVSEKCDFFIQLADMPLIKADHYKKLLPYLKDNDAVQPFVNSEPGHPVLMKAFIKDEILKESTDSSVKNVLKKFKVAKPALRDTSYIKDIDTPEDLD